MKQMYAKDTNTVKSKTYLHYQKRAVEELERSVKMGFVETELIQSDPDLDLIRDLPEYKTIIEGLPKPKPVEKEPAKKVKPAVRVRQEVEQKKQAAAQAADAEKAAVEAALKAAQAAKQKAVEQAQGNKK